MIDPLSAEADDGAPDLADATAAALALYAQDLPLDAAAAPLVRHVEACAPGWIAALARRTPGLTEPEIVCAPNANASERAAALSAIRPLWTQPVNLNLAFNAPSEPAPGLSVCVAGLQITDHNLAGALALIAPTRSALALSPAALARLQPAARVLALLLEDRAALARLRERDAVLALVLDMAPDAIVRIDAAGRILSFNRAAERLFGYAAAEAIGQPVHVLMTDDHAGAHQGYVERYVKSGERRLQNWRRRLQARTKSGGVAPIELAIGDVLVDGERQFISVIRDVTDREREAARRDALREALAHATQLSALGEMAATIAHEVNQPLTAIGNYIDAALAKARRAETALDPELFTLLSAARDQARLGGEIVRRVRRLTTRRAPERSITDLNEAVREALGYIVDSARSKGVTIGFRLAEPAPVVFVDRIQIQQAAANLVRNAVDAVAGSAAPRVDVETQRRADAAVLIVSDNGPGVPEALRSRIFDSFMTTREGGVGLGLAVTRSIIEAHQGEIRLRDSALGGAAFEIVVPLSAVPTGSAAP